MASTLVLGSALTAATPAGLRGAPPSRVGVVPERNWQQLGIAGWELRLLERVDRGSGYETYHIGYTLGSTHATNRLHLTGFMARPFLRDGGTAYPAIILNHGGTAGVSAPYRAVAEELASRGYVVLASTFRGEEGREGRSQGLIEFAKGEVLDVLQLAELARKLAYVDSLRMGILGHGHGAAVTLQAIGRSNVFKAAVAVSPPLFSGLAENNYAGMPLLREMAPRLFGRELSEYQLRRELLMRDAFRFMSRIRSPVLLVGTDQDPSYEDQLRFVSGLEARGIDHRYLRYPGLSPDFLFAYDDGSQPANWHQHRDEAWSQIFSFLEDNIPAAGDARALRAGQ